MAKAKTGGDADGGMVYPAVPGWQTSVGTFIAGQAEIDEVDALAIEMEDRWGVDRLRMLVSVELRVKFDRQRYLLNQAIWHGELADVTREARRMAAAWRALDKAAQASQAPQRPADVWEVALPDNRVVAIVRTVEDAKKVLADGRHVDVYTLEEIAQLIHGFPQIAKIKMTFPGATVERVRTRIEDPLNAVKDSKAPIDDPMPF